MNVRAFEIEEAVPCPCFQDKETWIPRKPKGRFSPRQSSGARMSKARFGRPIFIDDADHNEDKARQPQEVNVRAGISLGTQQHKKFFDAKQDKGDGKTAEQPVAGLLEEAEEEKGDGPAAHDDGAGEDGFEQGVIHGERWLANLPDERGQEHGDAEQGDAVAERREVDVREHDEVYV